MEGASELWDFCLTITPMSMGSQKNLAARQTRGSGKNKPPGKGKKKASNVLDDTDSMSTQKVSKPRPKPKHIPIRNPSVVADSTSDSEAATLLLGLVGNKSAEERTADFVRGEWARFAVSKGMCYGFS